MSPNPGAGSFSLSSGADAGAGFEVVAGVEVVGLEVGIGFEEVVGSGEVASMGVGFVVIPPLPLLSPSFFPSSPDVDVQLNTPLSTAG